MQGSASREEPKADARQPAGRDAWARARAVLFAYSLFTVSFAVGASYFYLNHVLVLLLEVIFSALLGALYAFSVYRKSPAPLLSPAQRASGLKTAIVLGHVAGGLIVAAMYLQGLASWLAVLAALFLLLGALLPLYRVYLSLAEDHAHWS